MRIQSGRATVAIGVVAAAAVGGTVLARALLGSKSDTAAPPPTSEAARGALALTRAAPVDPARTGRPKDFQRYFASDGAGWAAADGTTSVPLDDGRTLWLFQDSFVRPTADRDATMVRNSAVVQDGTTLRTQVTARVVPAQPAFG